MGYAAGILIGRIEYLRSTDREYESTYFIGSISELQIKKLCGLSLDPEVFHHYLFIITLMI